MILRIFCFYIILGIFACNNNPKQEVKGTSNENKSKDTSSNENYHPYKDNEIILNDQLSKIIPSDYSILDTATGDLNQDGIEDILIVLKSITEEKNGEELRPLLIVLRDEKSKYRIAHRNDNVIYCYWCGGVMGDPYMGLAIKNGYFSAEFYGGSREKWTRTITFKYDKTIDNWCLHKDGNSSFDGLDESENPEVDEKILTRKDFGEVLFEKFNYNDIYNQ